MQSKEEDMRDLEVESEEESQAEEAVVAVDEADDEPADAVEGDQDASSEESDESVELSDEDVETEPPRQIDFSTLNRIFDGRLACRHLSDQDLFDLRDWHQTLRQMLLQKGDRFLLAIQSLQIDIDKIDRTIDFRQAQKQGEPVEQVAPRPASNLASKPVAMPVRAREKLSRKEEALLAAKSSKPQNEGQVFVLANRFDWKNRSVNRMVEECLEEAAQAVEDEVEVEDSIDQRLSDSYNGGASPYGYRGTFG